MDIETTFLGMGWPLFRGPGLYVSFFREANPTPLLQHPQPIPMAVSRISSIFKQLHHKHPDRRAAERQGGVNARTA